MVSGNGQEGTRGEPLREPFVVRVTNALGAGVEGAAVVWNVTSREGGHHIVIAARLTPLPPWPRRVSPPSYS
jgi:hypothetical protein